MKLFGLQSWRAVLYWMPERGGRRACERGFLGRHPWAFEGPRASARNGSRASASVPTARTSSREAGTAASSSGTSIRARGAGAPASSLAATSHATSGAAICSTSRIGRSAPSSPAPSAAKLNSR